MKKEDKQVLWKSYAKKIGIGILVIIATYFVEKGLDYFFQ